jgi:hypothetical protein
MQTQDNKSEKNNDQSCLSAVSDSGVSCVALGYEDIKVLWKGNITLLEMIGFMRVQKRAMPRSVEDSRRILSKELDYRIGLSGVVFKPPWGADLKRIGIERQGQSSANVCMLSICMVWL